MLAAADALAGAVPAVVLEGAYQIAHGAGVFGAAAGPDKTGFNPAIISVRHIHGSRGLFVGTHSAGPVPNKMGSLQPEQSGL